MFCLILAPAKERTWMDESKLCRCKQKRSPPSGRLHGQKDLVQGNWKMDKQKEKKKIGYGSCLETWLCFYIFVTIIFPMMDSTGQWSRLILLYPSSRSDKYYVILSILMFSSLYHIISHRCHKVIFHSYRNTSSVQCQLYWKEHSILKSLEAD